MSNSPKNPLSHNELNALTDRRLEPSQRQALESRLTQEPQQRETLAAWRTQRQALEGLYGELLSEPLPASMLQAARRVSREQQSSARALRWSVGFASVLLAFGLGWFGHTELGSLGPVPQLAGAQMQQEFVHQAGLAHAVYLPEKRHPVEVGASEQEHLVQWLSKRVGRTLHVPNLSAQGFALVGGRLLPGEAGPRAQFMFQNAEGTRVTLYLGQVQKAPDGGDAKQTRFQFAADKGTSSFYWFDEGFGCALSGQLSRPALMALADTVYAQLWPETSAN